MLVGGNLAQVESWLQGPYSGALQFTNVFDKSSTSTSSDFHNAVDGLGPTVVLIEAIFPIYVGLSQIVAGYSTEIIGGHDPQSWSVIGGYNLTPNVSDRTAFIFNLTTRDIRYQQTVDYAGQYQTYNDRSYGPTFGYANDIYTDSTLNTGVTGTATYCADPTNTCWNSTSNTRHARFFSGVTLVFLSARTAIRCSSQRASAVAASAA